VRMPTFSRHAAADTTDDERPTVATSSTTPVRGRSGAPSVTEPTDATTTRWTSPKVDDRDAANRDANVDTAKLKADQAKLEADRAKNDADVTTADADPAPDRTPVVAGPKPRASLLATLGLILAVAGAMLVLSGPLLGYGIGVSALALILSLCGIHATGRRHVAGKSDALIGMVLALGAIVVGVLALTGSLSWLGTDMQPVTSVREWLNTHFANRF
jgi:hypothetical protein